MEEFGEAFAQFSSRPSRWCCTTDSNDLVDNLLLFACPVLQCAETNQLAYEFDRWLRFIHFLQRHVHIVNHQDAFHLTRGWPNHIPSAHAFEFVLNQLLRNVTASLRGLLDKDRLYLLRILEVREQFLARNCFANSCHACEEHWLLATHFPFHHSRE